MYVGIGCTYGDGLPLAGSASLLEERGSIKGQRNGR